MPQRTLDHLAIPWASPARGPSAVLLTLSLGVGLSLSCVGGASAADAAAPATPPPASAAASDAASVALAQVEHVIVIYQENWSFDGLYSQFPGADGVAPGTTVHQDDGHGQELTSLPQPLIKGRGQPYANGKKGTVDNRFPASLPMHPYDLLPFVPPRELTGDLIHTFYTEQAQIHGGAMDRFVAGSTNPGLVLGYYDATNLPEGLLAQEFVLFDHCFHSAFGGSFLNHQWLIAAATPPADPAMPAEWRSHDDADVDQLIDKPLSEDGAFVVNTMQPANVPSGPGPKQAGLWTHQTIGDELTKAGQTWAWYAGGWNNALSSGQVYAPPDDFQVHHQPFLYFAAFAATTAAGKQNRADHLKDEADFIASAMDGSLPAVSFVKPVGELNEHPGYSALIKGQMHVASLVDAVRKGPCWKSSVIIITYDEHGGRWDHVAPPVIDRWGPGVRVPMIVISPLVAHAHVDHTACETVSVLRLIERRWGLPALGSRDAKAGELLSAFTAQP